MIKTKPLTKDKTYLSVDELFTDVDDVLSALRGLQKELCVCGACDFKKHKYHCDNSISVEKWFPIIKESD